MSDLNGLVKQIDELYAKATEGEWVAVETHSEKYMASVGQQDEHRSCIALIGGIDVDEANGNANFIATLHNAWPQIRDAIESLRMDGWQPIETAPKDGTYIIVGNKHGSWIAKYLPVYQSGFRPENPWASMMLNHDHMGEKRHPPTHWRPLPEPPAAMKQTGGE